MSINPTSYTCHICLEPVTIPEGKTVSSIKKEKLAFTGTNALSESIDAVAINCNHIFHEGCLKRWIDEFRNKTIGATCPVCRAELVEPAIEVTQPTPLSEQPVVQNVQQNPYRVVPLVSPSAPPAALILGTVISRVRRTLHDQPAIEVTQPTPLSEQPVVQNVQQNPYRVVPPVVPLVSPSAPPAALILGSVISRVRRTLDDQPLFSNENLKEWIKKFRYEGCNLLRA